MRLRTLAACAAMLAAFTFAATVDSASKARTDTHGWSTTDVEFWPVPSDWDALAPCATEDSTAVDCKWDATQRGNGSGTSFFVRNGNTYYVRTP